MTGQVKTGECGITPLLIRHKEAQRLIGCGNSHYWQLVKLGKIEVVGSGKMGRAVYASLTKYVNVLRAEAQGKAA
jgi:hypothetical protein